MSKNSKSKQTQNQSLLHPSGRKMRKNKSQRHSIPSGFNLPPGWEMQVQFGSDDNEDIPIPSFGDQDVMKMFQSKLMKQFQQAQSDNHRSSSYTRSQSLPVKDSEVMSVMMSMFGEMLTDSMVSANKAKFGKKAVVKIKPKHSNTNANSDSENERDIDSHSARLPPPSMDWPPGIKEAAAAAIRSVHGNSWFAGNDEWGDGDEEDEDHDDDSIPDLFPPTNETKARIQEEDQEYRLRMERERQRNYEASLKAAEELIREEEEEAKKKAQRETTETSTKAAKKREKKLRKKARERKEAAVKDAEAAIKLREKSISTWTSRIVTACSIGDAKKVESLIANNPFRDGKGLQYDAEILRELKEVNAPVSFDEEVAESLKWLLVNCISKTSTEKDKSPSWLDARFKLSSYIASTSYSLVFELDILSKVLGGLSRSVFHNCSLLGDVPFIQAVLDQNTTIPETKDTMLHLNSLCNDLGWGAIHYAAVGGQLELVDLLLTAGCHVQLETKPSLTCHAKSRKGCTAKQLIESILSDNISCDIISKSDLIRDIIDTKRPDMNQYYETLKELVQRLSYVEAHGSKSLSEYDKMDKIKSDNESKNVKKNNIDDSKNQSFDTMVDQSNDDSSFISTLLAMGFGRELIDVALLANSGTRRNIDDIVLWLLQQTSHIEEGMKHSSSHDSSGLKTLDSDRIDTVMKEIPKANPLHVKASISKNNLVAEKKKTEEEGEARLRAHKERIRQEQSESMEMRLFDDNKKIAPVYPELHFGLHHSKTVQQNALMAETNFEQANDLVFPSSDLNYPDANVIETGYHLDAIRSNTRDFDPSVKPSMTYSSTQIDQHQNITKMTIDNMNMQQEWREKDFSATSDDVSPLMETRHVFPPHTEPGLQSRLQQYISRSRSEVSAEFNPGLYSRDQTVPHRVSSEGITTNEVGPTYSTSSLNNFTTLETHRGYDHFDHSIFQFGSVDDNSERKSSNQSWKSFGPPTSGSIW